MSLLTNLESYWKLDEASGNALDAHGSNTLTETSGTIASTTGKIGNCRDFEGADTEYFAIASNASLQAGDIDFTLTAWVNLESKGANGVIAGKDNTSPAGAREYLLLYRASSDRFELFAFRPTDTAVIAVANNLGSPSTATWYYVVAWHDATANTVNIQVNNGTVNSTATGGALQSASSAAFQIGAPAFLGANYFDGQIDEVGFWKRVLTTQERTDLYNSGNGLAYPFATGNRRRRALICGSAS